MKNLIILLYLLSISCEKAQKRISTPSLLNTISTDKNWNGDILISNLNFVNSIDSTCKLMTPIFNRSDKQVEVDDTRCAVSKIKFDYDKLNTINKKIVIAKPTSDTEIYIKKSTPESSDTDVSYQATLYIKKNKKIYDSLIIYQSFNYSEALTVKAKYYYINKNDIYLLDFAEDESGTNVEKWEHYNINASSKIYLVQRIFFKMSNAITEITQDAWKGVYHYEASNKDDVKTIFDIRINSLEDIAIDIAEEGVKNKYSQLKAEKISNEKIRINYDTSSDDMGIIYIERSGNDYFISGNPIYFINPGNNEMPLKKLK